MSSLTELTELIECAKLDSHDSMELLETISEALPKDVLSDFVKSNISYYDALEVVQTDDQFYVDFMERTEDLAIDEVVTNPKDLVYSLVYDHPDVASSILNELIYYRNKGRI